MQTKKRAKPVKFGKPAKKEAPLRPDSAKASTGKQDSEGQVEDLEKITKETAEADINSDEAKEIKKIIEEKTHPHEAESNSVENEEDATSNVEEDNDDMLPEQEEATENEPAEIRLSEEPEEKKEEEMALESTESSEVEPEELPNKQDEEKDGSASRRSSEEGSSQEEESKSAFGSFTNDAVKKEPKKGFFKFFIIVAFITFLVGLAIMAGVSYFYSSDKEQAFALPSLQEPTTTPTPTPSASSGPTATPEAVDLTAYGVRVLNGSGISGEAAKVRDDLEEKGFTVSGVGNAATSDYTKTVISAKEDVDEEYLNELIKALQDQYSVNSVVEDAPSTQTADVVVTVGSDSAE